MTIFLSYQLMKHPLIKLFHLSNLLQMLNDHKMVEVEFFGNFLCSCKRIGFDDCSLLVVVNFYWPITMLLKFKSLISSAKLLEPLLHCKFLAVPGLNALLMMRVIPIAFQPILNSNRKTAQICFLSNIISLV